MALALCLNRVPYSNKVSAPRLGLNQYKEKPSLLALSLQLRTLLPSLKLVQRGSLLADSIEFGYDSAL